MNSFSTPLRPLLGHSSRWLRLIVTAVLILGGLAIDFEQQTTTSQAATSLTPPFPRVATIYSKTEMNSCEGKLGIARHTLYVTDLDWWPDRNYSACVPSGSTYGQYLKSLNPNLIAIVYYHSALFEDGGWKWRPGATGYSVNGTTYYIDLRWILTYAGSTLTQSIGPTDTTIPVGDLSRFNTNERIIIGGVDGQSWPEMAHITGKSGSSGPGTLTVKRGINDQNGKFPAGSHNSGDYVRSAAYAFGNPAYMVMNLTDSAPRTNINPQLGNQTWAQFVGSFLAVKLAEAEFQNLEGVFLDNFVSNALELVERLPDVDGRNNNTASGASNAEWSKNVRDLAADTRSKLPGKLIVGNTGGDPVSQGPFMNGGMIEGVDQNGMNPLVRDVQGFYREWLSRAVSPPVFLMNASATRGSTSDIQYDYQAMRFLLTLTLSGDGYFVYDEYSQSDNSQDHKTMWWYDEYDNAGSGTGYLGYPTGVATQPIPGVLRRDFANGLSLSNTTDSVQTVNLGGTYRKIRGVQVPSVNDGSTVDRVTLQPKDGIILLKTSVGSTAPVVSSLLDWSWTSANNGWGPVERNTSNGEKADGDGQSMRIGGRGYPVGIGTNPYSEITYFIAGRCSSITVDVGIDDEVGNIGTAVFEIYGDGTKITDSGVMRGGQLPKTITADLTGRQRLRLIVTDGGDGGWMDHANWAAPMITCTGAPNGSPPVIPTVPTIPSTHPYRLFTPGSWR